MQVPDPPRGNGPHVLVFYGGKARWEPLLIGEKKYEEHKSKIREANMESMKPKAPEFDPRTRSVRVAPASITLKSEEWVKVYLPASMEHLSS